MEPEVKIEYTIFLNGTLNGNLSVTDSRTLVNTHRDSNGIYYGQGQGIISSSDGRDISTWISLNRKLAFLNKTTVFRSETDVVGNISNKEWQWR